MGLTAQRDSFGYVDYSLARINRPPGGLLIVQGVGAVAGPIIAGFAMSVLQRGLSHTIIAAQILMAAFAVYRLRRRAAPSALHKRSFVVEPAIPVATTLESEHSRTASPATLDREL